MKERSFEFLLLFLIALLFTACSRNTPTPTVAPPTPAAALSGESPDTQVLLTTPIPGDVDPNATRVTPVPTVSPPVAGHLVIWHSWAGPDAEALDQILARAQIAYPDLVVDTLFVAYDDLFQSYADAVTADGGPDLLMAPNWWMSDLLAAGVLQPLDDLVDPQTLAGYLPAAVENLQAEDSVYGLPTSFEVVGLYFNRSLVSPDQLPASTEQLLALSRQDPHFGIGLYASLYHQYWGIPAYGGRLMDDSGRIILDQDSGAVDFLGWLREINQTPGSFVSLDYSMLIDRFKKGEYAFFVDGPWSRRELQDALGADLAVAMLPAGPAGPATPWLSADGIFLNPVIAPEQQWLAITLAYQLTSPENGAILAQVAGRLPAQRGANVGDDAILQGFMAQASTAHPESHATEMAQVWGYAGDMIVKVINGVATPEDAVLEATTLINEANGR